MDLSHLKGITSTNADPSLCAICSNALPDGPHYCNVDGDGKSLSILAWCCGKRLCRGCKNGGMEFSFSYAGVAHCNLCDKEDSATARDAAQILKKHAKRGRPWAQFVLSELMVESSYDAVRWFRKAADLGHPEACLRLGQRYAVGDGCIRDVAEARKVLEKAVSLDNNYVDAVGEVLVKIARVCWKKHEIDEATSILTPLAEDGILEAEYFLGFVFANTLDYANGIKWLRRAAIKGEKKSIIPLVASYLSIGKNPQARFWFNLKQKQIWEEGKMREDLVDLMNMLRLAKEQCGECGIVRLDVATKQTCKQCRAVSYCSRECFKRHWNRKGGHADDCKEAKYLKENHA